MAAWCRLFIPTVMCVCFKLSCIYIAIHLIYFSFSISDFNLLGSQNLAGNIFFPKSGPHHYISWMYDLIRRYGSCRKTLEESENDQLIGWIIQLIGWIINLIPQIRRVWKLWELKNAGKIEGPSTSTFKHRELCRAKNGELIDFWTSQSWWLWKLDQGPRYGGFLKWWYPTTMGFPTKHDHFGVFWGFHHLRKHPYMPFFWVPISHLGSKISKVCFPGCFKKKRCHRRKKNQRVPGSEDKGESSKQNLTFSSVKYDYIYPSNLKPYTRQYPPWN